MKKALATVLTFCMLVNSCYFNSAEHLFTQAGYEASANSADTQLSQYVYMYGDEYYIELPRYRQGKELILHHYLFSDDKRTVKAQPTGEVSMFRIPKDFAMYLTGQAKSPSTPSYMIPVNHANKVKRGTRIPITNQGAPSTHEFKYSSPFALLWYTVGVYEWLIVDLPLTVLENASVIIVLAAEGYTLAPYIGAGVTAGVVGYWISKKESSQPTTPSTTPVNSETP